MSNPKRLCVALAGALFVLAPLLAVAFELIELQIGVTLEPGATQAFIPEAEELPNTGFSLANPGQVDVSVVGGAALYPAGPLQGEALQPSFALYDRTLLLQVTATDENGGRADLVTTYRMDVDESMLRADVLSALFLEQGVSTDPRQARARARALGLTDARVMRFVDDGNGGTWIPAVRALDGQREQRFMPRMEPDGVVGHYGYVEDAPGSGSGYVWAVMDRNSKYNVGITVDLDGDGVPTSEDACRNTAPGELVDATGCAIVDYCPCEDDWRSHLEYNRCVRRTSRDFLRDGLITLRQKLETDWAAATSSCGRRSF